MAVGYVTRRGRGQLAARLRRLRLTWWRVAQCAVAAGVAWLLAVQLLGHEQPFLAPIAAVVGIGTAEGRKLRRVAEIVGGVAVGVLVADLLVAWLGTGTWQLVVVVALAMTVAVFADASPLLTTQAAVNGIIVATLLPDPDEGLSRWIDAAVGGAVALAALALAPLAAYRTGRETAAHVAGRSAAALRACARAVREGDIGRADRALAHLRETDPELDHLVAALTEGEEVVKVSPIRRGQREQVARYVGMVVPLDRAVRNLRVLARRVVAGLRQQEPGLSRQAGLLEALADALDMLSEELRQGVEPVRTRAALIEVGKASADPAVLGGSLSAQVVLAQVRSAVVDLLQVTGVPLSEAIDAIPPVPVSGAAD